MPLQALPRATIRQLHARQQRGCSEMVHGAHGAPRRAVPAAVAGPQHACHVIVGKAWECAACAPLLPATAAVTPRPRSGLMHAQGGHPGWADLPVAGLDWRARGTPGEKRTSSYAATLALQTPPGLCWTDDSVAEAILGHASASMPGPSGAALGYAAAHEPLLCSFMDPPRRVRPACAAAQRGAALLRPSRGGACPTQAGCSGVAARHNAAPPLRSRALDWDCPALAQRR